MIRLQNNEVIYNNSENLGAVEDMHFIGNGFSISLPNETTMFIPEEDCTQSEREVFTAYHEYYKDTGGIKPVQGITLEQARLLKIQELDISCNAEINDGFVWNGRLFGLDEVHDQLNIEVLKNNIMQGLILDGTLEYYAKGQPCEPFSNADFMSLYGTAMNFKTERIRTCKAKKVEANIATTVDELELIIWEKVSW